MNNRRGTIDIARRILSLAKDDAVNRTHIMYKANLSHTQLKAYLEFLIKQELLKESPREKEGSRRMYEVTEKGMEFLSLANRTSDLIKMP